jgi:adenine-specific DNA-methyltransferase
VEVVNDELVITDEEGQIFEYRPGSSSAGSLQRTESQRVQEALFHEKQTLIENCLFGVDINPNSVKICRLRLWIELLKNAYYRNASELETLPNIDINIKCGNSLVSRFALDADLSVALSKSKFSIESYKVAVQSYRNASNKEEKRELTRLIEAIKNNFQTYISQTDPLQKELNRIGNELFMIAGRSNQEKHGKGLFLFSEEEQYGNDKKLIQKRNQKIKILEKRIDSLLEKRKDIYESVIFYNSFEWRFEFPEVLDDDGKYLGFDIVIGNPPYIRQEELGQFKAYLKEHYKVYAGTADLLVYFFELSMNILKANGYFCLITSNKFVKANYGKRLRNYIREYQLTDIIDFGELPVFEEAATFPAIYQITKSDEIQPVRFTQVKELKFSSLHSLVNSASALLSNEAFGNDFWSLGDDKINSILQKIMNAGKPLGDFINGEIYYGIKTGFNKAFIIDENKKQELISEDPHSAEIIFPFAIGDDVRFYHIRDKKRFVILSKIGIDINRYPAVFKHLKQYQEDLEKRWDKGDHWWELRACAYYDMFKNPKIVYPDIAKESRFSFSEGTQYFGNTCYFIPSGDNALLGLLNSKVIWFYYSKVASVLGDAGKGGRLRWFSQDVVKIPIPDYSAKSQIIEKHVNEIIDLKKYDPTTDTSTLEQEIDRLVYGLYGLTEEEIGIVEGAT